MFSNVELAIANCFTKCNVLCADGDGLLNIPSCYLQSSPYCNCSFIKSYKQQWYISCTDSSANCTWYHKLNNSLVPIEEKFRTNDSTIIKLLGHNDSESYGWFIAVNSSEDACHYLVVPPLNGM